MVSVLRKVGTALRCLQIAGTSTPCVKPNLTDNCFFCAYYREEPFCTHSGPFPLAVSDIQEGKGASKGTELSIVTMLQPIRLTYVIA